MPGVSPSGQQTLQTLSLMALLVRGRPKVEIPLSEIPLSAVTENRSNVTYHILPKPYVPGTQEGLSAENRNRKSIVSEPTRL